MVSAFCLSGWKAGSILEAMKAKKSFPLGKVYRLLESGPVILLATASKGRANVMPMSWHTMIDFDPPLVGIIVDEESLTFQTLRATRECTINIPTVSIGKPVVGCGRVSGRKADKFQRFGLTPLPAGKVGAPLVGECYANLECRVVDARLAKQYNLFIVQVVQAWVDPSVRAPKTLHHLGGDQFMIAGRRIRIAPLRP